MLRLLLLSVLAFSLPVPPVAALTSSAVPRSTYITGTALDQVPAGRPGVIDVVPLGTYDSVNTHAQFMVWPYGVGGLPVVVWNNTTAPITHVHVLGMIRTATGALRAAMDVPVYPGTIRLGEFGFTAIPFADQIPDAPAPDDVVSFEVFFPEAAPTSRFGSEIIVPLGVTEAEAHDDAVSGTVYGVPLVSGEQVVLTAVLCFDPTGTARDMYLEWDPIWDPVDVGKRAAGHAVAVDLQGPCDRFLITAQSTFDETAQQN